MTGYIEKLARAWSDHYDLTYDLAEVGCWDRLSAGERASLCTGVRAILTAARKATPAMDVAGLNAERRTPTGIFVAMIDAALAEEPAEPKAA
jgi:hypothetical protein